MEFLTQIGDFVKGADFFWYHGYGLTLLWVVASTVGILAKKINLYLHAAIFFIVDVSTIFLVGGAFYRYLPKFAQFSEWDLVRKLHVFGGIFVLALIIVQHLGGAVTLMSESKRNPQHKKFAFWVSNLARVIVVLGWILKGGDTSNLLYVSIASAVLLVGSFYKAFLAKHVQQANPEEKTPKPQPNKED